MSLKSRMTNVENRVDRLEKKDPVMNAAPPTGMPPTGGLGVGVDRLLMMLLHVPIRSTLSFPFVKPDRTDTRRGSDLP